MEETFSKTLEMLYNGKDSSMEKREDHVRITPSRNINNFSAPNKYNILTPHPQQAHHSAS
jgi:hypothetical protein